MITLIMAFALVLTGTVFLSSQSANAAEDRPLSKKVSCIVFSDKSLNKIVLDKNFTYDVDKCTSSDKKVAVIKGKSSKAYLFVKKKGKAAITIYAKKDGASEYKKYKVSVKAFNYTNPFKTYKIGKKDYKSKYNKNPHYGAGAIKGKINIKAAKGWRLVRIEKMGPQDDDFIRVKNGSSVKIPQMGEVRVTMKHKASGNVVEFSNVAM